MYGVDGERDADRGRSSTIFTGTRAPSPSGSATRAYDQRQHDVWGAVLDSVYIHTRSRDRLDERIWPMLRRQVECRPRALARTRPRHLGGARRAEALHLLEGHVLGGGRPRRAARPASARTSSWPSAGRPRPTRSTPTSAPTASTSAACSPSTTAPTPSTRRCCSSRSCGFLPPDDPRVSATVLAIADELTVDGPGPALPGRRRPTTA